MKEVKDALAIHAETLRSVFMFYACGGSADTYHLSLNSFTAFLDDCKVSTVACHWHRATFAFSSLTAAVPSWTIVRSELLLGIGTWPMPSWTIVRSVLLLGIGTWPVANHSSATSLPSWTTARSALLLGIVRWPSLHIIYSHAGIPA